MPAGLSWLPLLSHLLLLLQVTKLNAISMLSGLAVVLVNWLVTLAVRRVRVGAHTCGGGIAKAVQSAASRVLSIG